MLTNNDGDTHSISVGILGMHITYYNQTNKQDRSPKSEEKLNLLIQIYD